MTNPAAPKSIVRVILIFVLSACMCAVGPSAFAQRGGSRGGSVSHGGGGSHGGTAHGSGASHSGGSVRSGGPYGGSGGFVHSGSAAPAPARMASGSGSHSFISAGSRSGNYTGNSFVAPPVTARPVERAARTIFMNANAQPELVDTNNTVGARPFAAGNYLWGTPPQQQAHPHVVAPPPPPSAPRPFTMPSAQPMHPTVMQSPSPIRPMYIPSPMPMQGPRPIGMPMARPAMIPISPMPSRMPSPLPPKMLGGRFVAPRLRALRPFAVPPAPPTFRTLPPRVRPVPVRPVFGRIAEGPAITRPPISAFTARAGASVTPTHSCINTITHCGIGTGGLDGDGDFDNDGFGFEPSVFLGFFGPFGFSPFDFGSTCFFNGVFQDCFLTPAEFSSFGFGSFGFNSFGFGGLGIFGAPYGSSFLYQPPVENLPATFGDYLPNTNYAPSYSYEPAPLPVREEPPSANTSTATQPIVDLVMKDGTVFAVTSYWLVNDRLNYITTYRIQSSVPIDQLNLQKTVDMNWKRGVAFTLTPQPATQNAPPKAQPQVQE